MENIHQLYGVFSIKNMELKIGFRRLDINSFKPLIKNRIWEKIPSY